MATHNSASPASRTGVWILGAKGDIAATLVVGALALARGLSSKQGLITATPPFDRLGLAGIDDLVFGGVDIAEAPFTDSAEALYRRSRTVSREVLDALGDDLRRVGEDIGVSRALAWGPGTAPHGDSLAARIDAVRQAIADFRARHTLERVIVVNLASAEEDPHPSPLRESAEGLDRMIAEDRCDLLTPSVCYAYAAFSEDCPYVNFTPNPGLDWTGLRALADARRLPYAGCDGKTGETLVKTALAPMFAIRNLRVMSWEGINLLGNNDGRVLDDPRNRAGKMRNKGGVLGSILGYEPHAGIDIKYVPSLGDWKTAWDLIHFEGFLDVPMQMQFTWQGCDSILAAPLVLDLVRLTDFAARRGESGPLRHLAVFFKSPLDTREMDLHRQYQELLDYAGARLPPATMLQARA